MLTCIMVIIDRFDIEELFKQTDLAFTILCRFAPKDKAEELGTHVVTLRERMEVLGKIDEFLGDLFQFNKALVEFDAVLISMDTWINGKAQVNLIPPHGLNMFYSFLTFSPSYSHFCLSRISWQPCESLMRRTWRRTRRRG